MDRGVNFQASFKPNDGVFTRRVYASGLLDVGSIQFGQEYTGVIKSFSALSSSRNPHELRIWFKDEEGNEYTLRSKVRLLPSQSQINLLSLITELNQIYIGFNGELGVELITPQNLAEGESITVLGYAEETGYPEIGIEVAEVVQGGTGRSELTTGAILVGGGTEPVQYLLPGNNGQTIVSQAGAWTVGDSLGSASFPDFSGLSVDLDTLEATLGVEDTGLIAFEGDETGRLLQRWEWDGQRFLTLERIYLRGDVSNVTNTGDVFLPLERVPYISGCLIESYHQQIGISGTNNAANYYNFRLRYRIIAYGANQTPSTEVTELSWSTQNITDFNGYIFEHNTPIVLPAWPNRFESRRERVGTTGNLWYVFYATLRGIR